MTVARASGARTGAGGLQLFWQSWHGVGAPRAVVVIVHGLGEHSDRHDHVARALVAEGCAVYAVDHRGHGRSQGPRALIDDVDALVADIDALVLVAHAAHPDVPVYMLGNSFGGMLAVRYALAHQDRLAGLILNGALAQVDASPALRVVGRVLAAVAPRAPLIVIDPELVSRDPAVVEAYRTDPLVHHGRIPARTAATIADTAAAFPDAVGAIALPVLIAYGTADAICPPAGSEMLAQRIGSGDVTVRRYEGLYHELHNEPEREAVLGDVVAWLGDRLSLPARGDGPPAATPAPPG